MTLPPRLGNLAHPPMGLTSGYSSTSALRLVPKLRYQPGTTEHSDDALLCDIDYHRIARLVTEKRNDAILAMTGLLHGAFMATDHEGHSAIMTRGCDDNSGASPSGRPSGTAAQADRPAGRQAGGSDPGATAASDAVSTAAPEPHQRQETSSTCSDRTCSSSTVRSPPTV